MKMFWEVLNSKLHLDSAKRWQLKQTSTTNGKDQAEVKAKVPSQDCFLKPAFFYYFVIDVDILAGTVAALVVGDCQGDHT